MEFKLLIDGQRVDGAGRMPVINPATGEILTECPRADLAQLEQAVAAARRAFPGWSALDHAARQDALGRLADAMEARFGDFARILTAEQGKPLAQAEFEVGGAIAAFRYFGAQELRPETLVDEAGSLVVEQYFPLGVVACITPWNFPLVLLAIKVAAALSTGNTVVAKPAPTTPLTALLLGECAAEVLPPGVFHTLVDANDLGAALTAHPVIAKVSFTGSTATGRRVMSAAAATLKRLTLELGGNDAAVLLDDVDLDDVAPKIFQAATYNAGQVCMAAKRIYVPRALADGLCDRLAALAQSAVVGDGMDPATQIGPIQNRMQFDKLRELCDDSVLHGKVLTGGVVLNRPGYFISPMVVRDLPESARLVREEQFGPLIPVLPYDSVDEAVGRANASEFGLAGTVWAADLERAAKVAARIETGTVWVNKHLDLRFDVPFGGLKQSGVGREQGRDGLKEFVNTRVVSMAR